MSHEGSNKTFVIIKTFFIWILVQLQGNVKSFVRALCHFWESVIMSRRERLLCAYQPRAGVWSTGLFYYSISVITVWYSGQPGWTCAVWLQSETGALPAHLPHWLCHFLRHPAAPRHRAVRPDSTDPLPQVWQKVFEAVLMNYYISALSTTTSVKSAWWCKNQFILCFGAI